MYRLHLKIPVKKSGKPQLFLPLIIIIATSSALIFYQLSATSLVTANKAILDYWRTSYDILVRPKGSHSAIETQYNLVEPNYQNNIKGAISFAQYEAIKTIPGVDVAAPIANLGSFPFFSAKSAMRTDEQEKTFVSVSPGVYAIETEHKSNEGFRIESMIDRSYKIVLPDANETDFEMVSPGVYVSKNFSGFGIPSNIPLAGIDPQQEARLFKLDQSIIQGLYLGKMTAPEGKFPVVINNYPYTSYSITVKLEQVDVPEENSSPEAIVSLGGTEYLDKLPSHVVDQIGPFESIDAYPFFIEQFQIKSGGLLIDNLNNFEGFIPVTYQLEPSIAADPEKLVLAVEAQPQVKAIDPSYKEITFGLYAVGIYDIARIPKPNEINQVPVETYFPPGGTLLYDENRNPVDPQPVLPSAFDSSWFTSPPLMLTTITAARTIAGDNCISAIRVRVAGIDSYSNEAEQKIESVATAIHEQTGLDVDIVVGSSPRPVLVHIPGVGYVEEMWIQKGVATNYSEGLSLANRLMLSVFGFVSFLAIFEYNWMDAYNRRREFALSKALGWRTGSLLRFELGKAAGISLACALVSCLVALAVALIFKLAMPQPLIFIEATAIVLGISILGSLAPALIASRAAPVEVIRDHADSKTVRLLPSNSILRIALNSLVRSPLQSLLNIAGVALSMALLCYLIIAFDSQRGYLGGTLLGQYLVVKLQPSHFFLTLTGLLMAVVAIAIYIRNRVQLEHHEIAVTNAIGWRKKEVRKLYLWQSGIIGLIGGAIGVVLSILINRALGGSLEVSSTAGVVVLATGVLLPTLACIATSFLAIRKQIELKSSTSSLIFRTRRKS